METGAYRRIAMKKYSVAGYIRLSMEDLRLRHSSDKDESCSVTSQRKLIQDFLSRKEEFREAEFEEYIDM